MDIQHSYFITEVEYKFRKNSPYRSGIGIFLLKNKPKDLDYEKCDCIILSIESLVNNGTEATHLSSKEVYNVHIVKERTSPRITIKSDVSEFITAQNVAKMLKEEEENPNHQPVPVKFEPPPIEEGGPR